MNDLIERDKAIRMLSDYAETQQDLDYYSDILIKIPAANCWIPCSDMLPEVGVPVLTFDGEYMRVERHIGWIDADGEKMKGEWWIDGIEGDNYNCVGLRDGTATHWMPLPEQPEQV